MRTEMCRCGRPQIHRGRCWVRRGLAGPVGARSGEKLAVAGKRETGLVRRAPVDPLRSVTVVPMGGSAPNLQTRAKRLTPNVATEATETPLGEFQVGLAALYRTRDAIDRAIALLEGR